jgi:hypothetical protein
MYTEDENNMKTPRVTNTKMTHKSEIRPGIRSIIEDNSNQGANKSPYFNNRNSKEEEVKALHDPFNRVFATAEFQTNKYSSLSGEKVRYFKDKL